MIALRSRSVRHYPRVLLAGVGLWVALCLAVELYLLAAFDQFADLSSTFTASRRAEPILNRRTDYLVGLVLLAATPMLLVLLDAETRARRRETLIGFLLFAPPSPTGAGRVTRRLSLVLTFAVLPALIVIHLGRNALGLRWLIEEDGPLEMLTVLLLGGAAVGLGHLAWRTWSSANPRHPATAAIPLGLAGAFFLFAFEEISWGQRIFGWETGELFSTNIQNETNLHNFLDKSAFYYIVGCAIIFLSIYAKAVAELTMEDKTSSNLWFFLPDRSLLLFWSGVLALSFEHQLDEFVEEAFAFLAVSYVVQLHEQVGRRRRAEAAVRLAGP